MTAPDHPFPGQESPTGITLPSQASRWSGGVVRIALALMVFALCLCGCSRGNGKSARSALDRIQAGRDISFGQYVVRVAKRQGTTVEGVRVVSRERDGRTATITASKGTLSQGPVQSCLTLVLQDAQVQKSRQKAAVGQLSLDLPVMGR